MAAPLRQCTWIYFAVKSHLQKSISRSYAKKIGSLKFPLSKGKKLSKVGAQAAKKTKMEVVTDPEQLLKYCCGANIYVDGKDPEIKPDSEYPDWLWNLRTERGGPKLEELDPDTMVYWRRLAKITHLQDSRIKKRLQRLKSIQYPDDKIS